jgi:hypothetical protein
LTGKKINFKINPFLKKTEGFCELIVSPSDEHCGREARANWCYREHRNWYYHGTQESKLERILKEGLKPNTLTGECNYTHLSKAAVYLTISKRSACRWAVWNRKSRLEDNPEKAFIIKIPKSRIDFSKLVNDNNLEDGQSFEYHGIIEPPFLVEEVFKPNSFEM